MFEPFKKEAREAQKEFKEKATTLILAGFGFVAALAWNDAVKAVFDAFLPQVAGVVGKIIYALLVTLIVVIISLRLKPR